MTRLLLRALNAPILILFVLIGVALQSSLFSSWPLSYFQPDVVLLVVIWCALRRGFGEGGVLTLVVGEIAELHTAAPQGLFLITYMGIYLCVRFASRFVVIPSLFSLAMITLFSSVAWKLFILIVLSLLGTGSNQLRHTFTFLFLGAAVEGIFSLWFFKVLDRFDWLTFKNHRAHQVLEDELQLDSEGF
ncbi:MAG: hypothetical protein HYX41_00760 [Bdellovibrio sp.]|nr:hypothetical protein [Bdellovibrio sp.]